MASSRPSEIYKQFFQENPHYAWSREILLPQLLLRRVITQDESEFVASLTTHSQRTVALFLEILSTKNEACQLKFILVLRELQEDELRTYLEEKFKDLLPEADNSQNGQQNVSAQGLEAYPVKGDQWHPFLFSLYPKLMVADLKEVRPILPILFRTPSAFRPRNLCVFMTRFGTTDPHQGSAIPKSSFDSKLIPKLPLTNVLAKDSSIEPIQEAMEELVGEQSKDWRIPLDESHVLQEEFRDLLLEAENLQNGQQHVSAQGKEACPVQSMTHIRTVDPNQKGSQEINSAIIRCLVIGDKDADKTRMLLSYVCNKPIDLSYVPTVYDNYAVTVGYSGKDYTLGLFDTSGQEVYDRIRPLSYPQTDVFLVCFSVISPSGFKSVREKWVPEITHHFPQTPFLFVGTNIDLRNDSLVLEKMAKNNQKPVSVKQGEKLARELGAVKYVECSALTQEGLKNVFTEAILAALEPPQRDNKKICSIS